MVNYDKEPYAVLSLLVLCSDNGYRPGFYLKQLMDPADNYSLSLLGRHSSGEFSHFLCGEVILLPYTGGS